MSNPSRTKAAAKLTRAELEAMAAEFDREFIADTFGPPPAKVVTQLKRAAGKRGRPRIGDGTRAISVTIEKSLLKQIDALAKRSSTPRTQLIARGLRAVLAVESPRRRASGQRVRGGRKHD